MNNMDTIRKNSASKYHSETAAKTIGTQSNKQIHIPSTKNSQTQSGKQIQIPSSSSSISSFQKSNVSNNHKRPNSFPSSSSRDIVVPTVRTKSLSRLISQLETSISDSENRENSKNNDWRHRDKAMKIILPLPHANNESSVNTSTDIQSSAFSETKFHSFQTNVSLRVKENTSAAFAVNENANLLAAQNSVKTSSYEEPRCCRTSEIKSEILAVDKKNRDVRTAGEHLYEEIDETDSACKMKCSEFNDSNINTSAGEEVRQKFDDNRTFPSQDEKLGSPVNQRCGSNQGSFSGSDNEKFKIKTEEYNIENDEDEIWKNYTDRPLLPLKPLQKQKSMSCVNLVQTIKGFSKRKNSNSRQHCPINNIKTLLFPENTLIQKKEMHTSEANISEIRTELVASADLTIRRMTDTDFAIKNTRQSLLPNYTWFHPIDAKEASKRLLKMQQNGAFLIRPASNPTSEVLHTLCVVFSRRVYNFHIKSLKDGRITLGKRKGQEETFSSLLDMIKYHQFVPISINSTESNEVFHVYLLITPPK